MRRPEGVRSSTPSSRRGSRSRGWRSPPIAPRSTCRPTRCSSPCVFEGECLIGQYGSGFGRLPQRRRSRTRHRGLSRRRDTTHRLVGDMADYIYSMVRARKAVGDKVILDDVTMAFLPGAKIGVVGPNGAGKSTILKIMAGLDQPSNGEARAHPRLLRRHPDAGAGARRVEDRARERAGGRRPDQGEARPVQRDLARDGRARRRLRRAPRRDGHPAGGDRRGRRVGPRLAARPGDGRAALPARRRAGVGALRR